MEDYERLVRERFPGVYAAALRCFGDEETAALVAQAAFLGSYRRSLEAERLGG